jgi:hypothetical protein
MPQHDKPVLLPAPPLPPGPRHALVIATASYGDPQLTQLRSPVREAADFAAVLGHQAIGGFAVTTLVEETAVRIRREIAAFLHKRVAEDTVLIYLSCHGLQDRRGRLLFAATDTEMPLARATAVRSADLLEELDECKARRQILILDCCFSGSFGDKAGGEFNLEQQLSGHSRGLEILTASRRFEYSYEGKPLNGVTTGSVFTTGLVEGLRDGAADGDRSGHITVEEAYDYAFRMSSGMARRRRRNAGCMAAKAGRSSWPEARSAGACSKGPRRQGLWCGVQSRWCAVCLGE